MTSTPPFPPSTLADRWIALSTRRPWITVLFAAFLVAASVAALARTHVSSSLQDMLGGDSEAAAALSRAARDFHTADDLLIMATAPDRDTRDEAAAKLARYAERLSAAVRSSSASDPLCTHLRWRTDDDVRDYAIHVLAPAGLLYLGDEAFRAVLDRLTPGAIQTELRKSEALVAAPGPAGSALSKAVLADPLRLRELVDADLGIALNPGALTSAPDLSEDGRSLLIRARGARPIDDLDFAKRFTEVMSRDTAAANLDALDLRIGGGYAIASSAARSIRADAISSTTSSGVLLLIFLALVYRRLLAPLLVCAVAAIGVVIGFGLHALFRTSLTPMTAVVAAMLGGLGVDYGIHFLSHYQSARDGAAGRPHHHHTPHQAAAEALRTIGHPLLTACLTTIFGFLCLVSARVVMLRDFAILGSLGLVGTLLAVYAVMPSVLVLIDRRSDRPITRTPLAPLATLLCRRAKLFVTLSLIALAIAAAALLHAPGLLPAFEADPTVMHPRPHPALDATTDIARRFPIAGEPLLIEVRAPDEPTLVARAREAAAALRGVTVGDAGVASTLGLHSLLPDLRRAPDRLAALERFDAAAALAAFDRAVDDSAFRPEALQPYRDFLSTLLSNRSIPAIADVRTHPALAEMVLPTAAPTPSSTLSTLMLVRLSRDLTGPEDRAAVVNTLRQRLAAVSGATLTGLSVITTDLEQATRQDMPRFALISFALVLGWLVVVFRRISHIALAMVPVVFAAVCMLGLMVLLGERFNIANIIALPLLAGIAVDNGVFLVTSYRDARRAGGLPALLHSYRASTQAIIGSAGTTIVAFGTLYWTSVPAVQSLGIVSAAGVIASLCGALTLLMPALVLLARRWPAHTLAHPEGDPGAAPP